MKKKIKYEQVFFIAELRRLQLDRRLTTKFPWLWVTMINEEIVARQHYKKHYS